ncbi:hypothetical protein MRX96_009121 [Rhipicephalus microplus]
MPKRKEKEEEVPAVYTPVEDASVAARPCLRASSSQDSQRRRLFSSLRCSAEEVGGPRKAVGRHSARACPRGGICLAAVAIRTPRPCISAAAACERALGSPRRRLPPWALKGCRECRRSSGRWR